MTESKTSFLKNLKPMPHVQNWRVSVFGWKCECDGIVSGEVIEAVETNDIGLALLAAHRMLDVHGPRAAQMITVEIAAAELIDGGQI
jgi:hypothetical protein